jgi:hypothetical protein
MAVLVCRLQRPQLCPRFKDAGNTTEFDDENIRVQFSGQKK